MISAIDSAVRCETRASTEFTENWGQDGFANASGKESWNYLKKGGTRRNTHTYIRAMLNSDPPSVGSASIGGLLFLFMFFFFFYIEDFAVG